MICIVECKDKAVEGTEDFLAYIYTYFEKFKIIICKSAGTKYEHYLDELAEVEETFYKQKIGLIREYMEITEQFNFGGWAAVLEDN